MKSREGAVLQDAAATEFARADKYQRLVDQLLKKLELERAEQARLTADAAVMRRTLRAQAAQISTYEGQLSDKPLRPFFQEKQELEKTLERTQALLEAERRSPSPKRASPKRQET